MNLQEADPAQEQTQSARRPLVVDLDGTLIRSDILIETIFGLIKKNPLLVFLLPIWLIKGKANLKHQIARRVDIDVRLLPYHEDFLDYLKKQHAAGRRLILATAAHEKFAHAVAQHLELFDTVIATDASLNASGQRKLRRLREQFGEGGFDYAGNGMIDLALWRAAEESIVVNPERGVERAARAQANVTRTFEDRTGRPLATYLRALRIHQWLKNALLFVPLVMAHRIDEPALVVQACMAFLAFGLCASSVYLLNDFFDLAEDRQHPTKRTRPFASGAISLYGGGVLMVALLALSGVFALLLPPQFVAALFIYFALTAAYSLWLKRVALVDVILLAGLYTLRIIAGAAAVGIAPSFWLLAFSMFLFLSLALVKRFTELSIMRQIGSEQAFGRGYHACADMSVVVLALYVVGEAVKDLYTCPQIIWLLCPLLLYLVMRIWLLAQRGELHEDPIVFALQDRRSQMLVVTGAALLWLAV